MALFAPQVRAVQPAFIYYSGEAIAIAKVYFSLSSYNSITEVDSVNYTIINPGQASTWGSNQVQKGSISTIYSSSIANEYYIEITIDKEKIALNQFYQVQLELEGSSGKSAPSQVTLIRAIPEFSFSFDLPDDVDDANDDNHIYPEDLQILSGKVESKIKSAAADPIGNYSIYIYKNSTEVYKKLNINNSLGTQFSTKIDYFFEEKASYNIKINYTTVHGYEGEETKSIYVSSITDNTINWESSTAWAFTFNETESGTDSENGAILFKFQLGAYANSEGGTIVVQKASEETVNKAWVTISEIYLSSKLTAPTNFQIEDFLIDANGITYSYRVLFRDSNGEYQYATTKPYDLIADYEDIFILDSNRQLAIRFNPNISGYKYITQESITNTLGSVYPIIRRNADTKYKQFTISGTLYFDGDAIFSNNETDSVDNAMSTYFKDTVSSFFLTTEEAYQYAAQVNWNINPEQKKIQLYEKKFRDAAVEFLTNGKPKLFRSPTEGNMLIYLSNISFTPNKTLGRKIYDFSATATEYAECTYANMIKGKVIISEATSKYIYVLEASRSVYDNSSNGINIIVTPYVNMEKIKEINNDNNNCYLILTAKKEKVD